MDNKSRDGYADAFTRCIIQGRIAKETFTFRDFITVQFVSRDKKRRDTPTGEYWTRNRCSRQAFRVGFQTFDFGVNLRWRLRRKQWTSFTSHQSIALVTNLYIYIYTLRASFNGLSFSLSAREITIQLGRGMNS